MSRFSSRIYVAPLQPQTEDPYAKPMIHIADQLSPMEAIAMLEMRTHNTRCQYMADHLKQHSTVRPSPGDKESLCQQGYARRNPNGLYELTPRGSHQATLLVVELAQRFEIKLPPYVAERGPTRRRTGFIYGMSERGNA